MGFFDPIDNTEAASNQGNYAFARAGHYIALIERLRTGVSKKHSCDYSAFDLRVLHVYDGGSEPMVKDEATGRWVPDPKGFHEPGEAISVQFMAKYSSAVRNSKAFLMGCTGYLESQITSALCAQLEQDQLLAGVAIELNNSMIELQNGNPFTKVWCVRSVPAVELRDTLSPEVAQRFFPGGFDALIEAEAG